ncbi:MAG: energy-coupling factor transporter transmembrane protein EcfT [Clostridiales bacterium]|nr:energy-coupling factor transporter transmembrane protein EcfT [Clostridiales bacterium]
MDSIIHSLDPRLKLISAFCFFILLFAIPNFWGYAVAAAFITALVIMSRVPLSFIFRGLRGIFAILVFTVIFTIFFTPGETALLSAGIIKITAEGLYMAARILTRLTLLMLISSELTLTTSPIQLTDAIEFWLKPLKKIRVPAHEIAMMMTIALRFIPVLLEETEKIIKAQKARGADLDTGGLIKKAKGLTPILVPLFVSAFRRADDLALAMESRCYRGDVGRTRMKTLAFSKTDYIAAAVLAGFVILTAATFAV